MGTKTKSETIGQAIRRIRQERGVSVFHLSQATGMHVQAIYRLEESDSATIKVLRRIAAALDTTVSEIVKNAD